MARIINKSDTVKTVTTTQNSTEKKHAAYLKAILPLKSENTLNSLKQAAGLVKVTDHYKLIMSIAEEYSVTVLTILSDIGIVDKDAKKIENSYNSWKSTNYHADGCVKTSDDRKADRLKKKSDRETKQAKLDKENGIVRLQGFPLEIAIELVNTLSDSDLLKLHQVMTPLLEFAKQAANLKESRDKITRTAIAQKGIDNMITLNNDNSSKDKKKIATK